MNATKQQRRPMTTGEKLDRRERMVLKRIDRYEAWRLPDWKDAAVF